MYCYVLAIFLGRVGRWFPVAFLPMSSHVWLVMC